MKDLEDWLYSGEFENINSKNVKAIAYQHDTRELLVRFAKKTARYKDVSTSVASDFYNTRYKGEFVNNILSKYDFNYV